MSEDLGVTTLAGYAADLLRAAKAAGADVARAGLSVGTSVGVQRRLGKVDETERAERRELSLTVFVGRKHAGISASDIDPENFARLAEQAVAMARILPDDRYAEIPEAPPPPDPAFLELDDPEEPAAEILIRRAAAAEDAALAVAGITNSEGAGASWSRHTSLMATTHGFTGSYTHSHHGVSATAIAGAGTAMQRDYDYAGTVHGSDLGDPAEIGSHAAERALARLDPRRPRTARMPVVYHPRVAGGIVGHFSSAIDGGSVARGTSFLKDSLGKPVFSSAIRIVDDPLRRRGLRSRAYDREGQPVATRALIEDGVLTEWLLDSRSATQLGVKTNGHAGGTTNLFLQAGRLTPAELMVDIEEGVFVTELIGQGVNGITGDYSRGAAGFMIRGGALAEPIAEFTVAGNLRQMFLDLTPADDLVLKRGTDAPTIRIDGMTVAGA